MGAAETAPDGAVAVTPATHTTGGLLRGLAEAPQDQGGQDQQDDRDGRGGGDGGHSSGLGIDETAGDEQHPGGAGCGQAIGRD